MKINKFFSILVIASFLSLISIAVMPQAAMAGSLVCGTPGTPPCPPSGGDSGSSKPGPKNRPTPVPTPIPTATATSTTPPITNSGAVPSDPNALLPAVQNPGQGSSVFNLPGPLGMLIALLIIVVCIGGGVFLFSRNRQISGNGKPGLSPFTKIMDTEMKTVGRTDIGDFGGGNESATVTRPDVGDFKGGNENFTVTRPDLKGGNENLTATVKDIRDSSAKF